MNDYFVLLFSRVVLFYFRDRVIFNKKCIPNVRVPLLRVINYSGLPLLLQHVQVYSLGLFLLLTHDGWSISWQRWFGDNLISQFSY